MALRYFLLSQFKSTTEKYIHLLIWYIYYTFIVHSRCTEIWYEMDDFYGLLSWLIRINNPHHLLSTMAAAVGRICGANILKANHGPVRHQVCRMVICKNNLGSLWRILKLLTSGSINYYGAWNWNAGSTEMRWSSWLLKFLFTGRYA